MITKALYALFHRNDVRAWVCALALGCVWLTADAANKTNVGKVSYSSNGRSVTIGPVTNSSGSTLPISPNLGGWTQAGNYGVPPGVSGTTMNLNGKGEAMFSGTKYPFQAGYQQPKSSWVLPALGAAAAIGCTFASGGAATVACLGLPAALPYLYEWMTRSGARINPETGGLERQDPESCTVAPCYEYNPGGNNPTMWFRSPSAACEAGTTQASGWVPMGYTAQVVSLVGLTCTIKIVGPGCTSGCNQPGALSQRSAPPQSATWYPSSMDDIVPYMRQTVPDGRVWGEALEKGVEFPLPDPVVTGPTQIQGPEKTTTNPDGSRTVERTTHNFQPSGNTITNTSNVTTATTYNIDNSVRNTTTTTTTPTPEERDEEDHCEKHPNTVGCADMDTPTGEIPRETKTITYAEESVFGGGSCPSDKQWSSGVMGGSYKLIDWQLFCGYALPARFLVILLATFAAFLIVMPGKEVRT